MRLKVFSILDTKADAFMSPFFMSTTGQAVRAFKDLVNDPKSSVYKHPGDYRLVHIGLFDDQLGKLESLDQVEPLGYGSDYRDLPSSAVPLGVVPQG